MNVGNVESTDSVPASADMGADSLEKMQTKLDSLEKQVEQKVVRDKLVYVALALSIISLLWNIARLFAEIRRKKQINEMD